MILFIFFLHPPIVLLCHPFPLPLVHGFQELLLHLLLLQQDLPSEPPEVVLPLSLPPIPLFQVFIWCCGGWGGGSGGRERGVHVWQRVCDTIIVVVGLWSWWISRVGCGCCCGGGGGSVGLWRRWNESRVCGRKSCDIRDNFVTMITWPCWQCQWVCCCQSRSRLWFWRVRDCCELVLKGL